MAIKAKGSEGSDFKPAPQGVHVARCVTVVDVGQQRIVWNDEVKYQHKVWIAFEVPGVRVEWTDKNDKEHEGPAIIGKLYTLNIGEKAHLGQHLTSWRGKAFSKEEIRQGFDISKLLDVPCQLSVVHNEANNGKTYANIATIMGLPAGMEAPKRETPLTLYDPESSEAEQVLANLPKWLQDKIAEGHAPGQDIPEHVAKNVPPAETYSDEAGFEDEIPF